MTVDEFRESVKRDAGPPSQASGAVQALWHDARGDWDRAHQCAQDDTTLGGSWVHAYLHRKEGDLDNAGYWYARARKPQPAGGTALEAEWAQIAGALLGAGTAK